MSQLHLDQISSLILELSEDEMLLVAEECFDNLTDIQITEKYLPYIQHQMESE